MKCPYAVTRKELTRTEMVYDDNGCQTAYIETKSNAVVFVEREKENCGAWHDGKCCYNQR